MCSIVIAIVMKTNNTHTDSNDLLIVHITFQAISSTINIIGSRRFRVRGFMLGIWDSSRITGTGVGILHSNVHLSSLCSNFGFPENALCAFVHLRRFPGCLATSAILSLPELCVE